MNQPRDPWDRRDDGPDEIERLLRQSLQRNAMKAPDGDMLAERIIHAAGRANTAPGGDRARRRFGWAVPVTVAAVVLVLAGVVLAVTTLGSGGGHQVAGPKVTGSHTPEPSLSPATSASVATTSANHATSPSTSSSAVTSVPSKLTGVQINDLTFDSTDSGWALATANCTDGSGGRCTALLHTDNGNTWQSRGGSLGFDVVGGTSCVPSRCVSHIRFADAEHGYAFSSTAFFTTSDGGKVWTQHAGQSAVALETVNQTVVRVSTATQGCPPGCTYTVQTADIGSDKWTTSSIHPSGVGVSLSLGGSDAYLLVTQHTTGGASSATSTLYRSANSGRSWTQSGEPCAQYSGEVDSTAISATNDGAVSVLCVPRQQPTSDVRIATSTNEGASFTTAKTATPSSVNADVFVRNNGSVIAVGGTGLALSTDNGQSFTISKQITGTVRFVGFESDQVGRVVTGYDTVWTTRDGGQTWTPTNPS